MNATDSGENKPAAASSLPVFKCEAYLIPVDKLKKDEIERAHRRYTYRFYDEKKCRACDNLEDRHNDLCDACPAFKGIKQTSKIVEKGPNNRRFLSLPRGDSQKVRDWLTAIGKKNSFRVVERCEPAERFKRKIKLVFVSYGSRENGQASQANVTALQQAGIQSVYYESPDTAHEWLAWRRSLREFAPRLFR